MSVYDIPRVLLDEILTMIDQYAKILPTPSALVIRGIATNKFEILRRNGNAALMTFCIAYHRNDYDSAKRAEKKVVVRPLAPEATAAQLAKEFLRYGYLLSVQVKKPKTCSGLEPAFHVGFVKFARDKEADDAKLALDKGMIGGRVVCVRELRV